MSPSRTSVAWTNNVCIECFKFVTGKMWLFLMTSSLITYCLYQWLSTQTASENSHEAFCSCRYLSSSPAILNYLVVDVSGSGLRVSHIQRIPGLVYPVKIQAMTKLSCEECDSYTVSFSKNYLK